MAPSETTITAEILVANARWLRSLAGYLTQDPADAEDLAQETAVAALRSPPDPARPARPWLGQVLRNALRSGARGATRRRAREEESAALSVDQNAPSAEEVLARMELHRRIAELVTALEDPYRTTLLLRFYEERDAAQIARSSGVPAGTVRWRISEGVKLLRERLDQQYGERRTAWRALLLPLATPPPPADGSEKPVPSRGTPVSTVVAAATGIFAVGAAAVWLVGAPTRRPGGNDRAGSAIAAAPSPNSLRRPPEINGNTLGTKESTMSKESLRRATILFGVAIPALVSAGETAPKLRDAAISGCMEMREKIFECKEAFAEVFTAGVPPEGRNVLRRKAIEEMTADGSGAVQPRRDKCTAAIDKDGRLPSSKEQIEAWERSLRNCWAQPDCTTRAACLMPILKNLRR
jgi:RNA polymerase sigma factor (sigma-70 family)